MALGGTTPPRAKDWARWAPSTRLGCTSHPPPKSPISTAFDHPGGATSRSIPPFSPLDPAGRPGAEPAAAEGRKRRGRASVSPVFGAADQATPEFSACGTAVVIAERDCASTAMPSEAVSPPAMRVAPRMPAETPAGGDAPPAAPAPEGSGSL